MPRKSSSSALGRLKQDVAALPPQEFAEFREWLLDHDEQASVQDHQAMKQTYTGVVKQQGDWWIGWIEEVPGVNCQERSREALLESLRATLAEAIAFNRDEARGAAGTGYEELPIAV